MFFLSVLAFVLVFTIVVVVHEAGHLIFAKLSGIDVFEFSVGLGPKIYSRKFGSTRYSIRALPLGGYVRIAGLDPNEEEPESHTPYEKTYNSKTAPIRALSIAAGPIMNFFLAALLTSIIIGAIGIATPSNVVAAVEQNSPASRIGLQKGDKIVALQNKPIHSMSEAIAQIHHSNGKTLTLTLLRGGQEKTHTVTPEFDDRIGRWRIGFAPDTEFIKPNVFIIPFEGIKISAQKTWEILTALFSLITGKISVAGLVGPVGIAYLSGQALQNGFLTFISFASVLSINLFIVNLLPIPALDGGRLFFIVLEMIFRRPILTPEREARVHQIGIVVLLALIAILTIKDIIRFPLPI